ncbi:hypothetical protein BCR36DRAFT_415960 [Piromyces finnis]|uniref:Uncharacterized protein n=1 Tax=Piromyces finnis TaxID=1754191 RepID=A0A1Y1UX46_9FUNG|nr:hypothetical protein BCR36DRAFT_415960 [Piromyces finnis]|eukprot:ORX42702.1 hypothetical protein BCR36DRAFT_415960 [Piromyces finnis]
MNSSKERNTELFYKELEKEDCDPDYLLELSQKGIFLIKPLFEYESIKYHENVVEINIKIPLSIRNGTQRYKLYPSILFVLFEDYFYLNGKHNIKNVTKYISEEKLINNIFVVFGRDTNVLDYLIQNFNCINDINCDSIENYINDLYSDNKLHYIGSSGMLFFAYCQTDYTNKFIFEFYINNPKTNRFWKHSSLFQKLIYVLMEMIMTFIQVTK